MAGRANERLRPQNVRDARAERSLIWVMLGTIERHSEHLPAGPDALTAHGLCLSAANRAGLFWHPFITVPRGRWTIMVQDSAEIESLLEPTTIRLRDLGVEHSVPL